VAEGDHIVVVATVAVADIAVVVEDHLAVVVVEEDNRFLHLKTY
jgi:hypothetical protein